jgi:transcriptional regulator with XRE-family HTH domain
MPPIRTTSTVSPVTRSDANEAGAGIGRRIRDLRQRAGMTLTDLSGRTGISIGTLSQLERDLVSPTVRTVFTVAGALGVPAPWLIDPDEPERRDVDAPFIVRANRRQRFLDANGVRKDIASPPLSERLKSYFMVIEPGCGSGSEPYTHSGEEMGFVLSGTLELQVDGQAYLLNEGDCFAFRSDRPHAFANVGPRPASVFWINAAL